MYQSMSERLKKRNVIGNLQKLLNGARGKAKIFYVPFQPRGRFITRVAK
jgi:hypothetical protein